MNEIHLNILTKEQQKIYNRNTTLHCKAITNIMIPKKHNNLLTRNLSTGSFRLSCP